MSAVVAWAELQSDESSSVQSAPPGAPVHAVLPDVCESASSTSEALLTVECSSGFGLTQPFLGLNFQGAIRSDTAADWIPYGAGPPDTMGAVGPGHFLEVINGNISVFNKATGRRISQKSLHTFFAPLNPNPGDYTTKIPNI